MILYIVLQKRKQYHQKLERQNLEHQFESQLMQSRLEVQEQSLQYLSEEIHDNIGQVLSVAKLHLYRIGTMANDDAIKDNVKNSQELVTKAIGDLRSLSHTMNGRYILKAGLTESIAKELKYIDSSKNINCNFNIEGTTNHIPEDKELLIFRIIQESISNALKHGNAENLYVTLAYGDSWLKVVVADDGEGFDPEDNDYKCGLGLNNMHVRAGLLKGKLDIQSEPNKGTTITLELPL
jgi:signal transduction histidine kinase